MRRYSEFQPTAFDCRGLNLPDQQDWYVVPVPLNRDSDCYEQSNFATALSLLGGESEDVEVHRFGHWACGWYETLLVKPGTAAETIARDIAERLENYPLLDEDDCSTREYEAAAELWAVSSVADRLHYIKRCGADPRVSPFAARRDELPEGIYANEVIS